MKFFRQFIYFFVLTISLGAFAQETEFTTEVSRKSLGQNEHLRVDFSINKNGDNFSAPNFDGFSILERGQSVQHINKNGKITQLIVFTFVLEPTRKGKLTIGEASIEVDNKIYKTKPISVTVTDAVQNPQNQTANANPLRGFGSGFPFGNFPFPGFDPFEEEEEDISDYEIPEVTSDEVFISAEVSKQNPYLNEAISIVYKLYVQDKYGFRQGVTTSPEFRNFVMEEEHIRDWKVSERMLNGKKYRVVTIKQLVLFPQKSGKVNIEPISVKLPMQIPTNKIDRFRRRLVISTEKNISGEAQVLDIKDLPQEGKPANFSGAVGSFSLETVLSKKEVKADETLNAKVKISGKGNFNLFEMPKLNFPSALEVYDPEQQQELTTSLSGIQGTVTNTYTIVPQYKGKYPIPSISFNYFNPETGKYVTEASNELLIDVTEGAIAQQGVQKQDVQSQVAAFRFLKLKADLSPVNAVPFFGSIAFYLWWLLPLLLIPAGIFYWKWHEARVSDVQGNRIRRANRLAKKYLSAAKKNLGQKDTFYEALERGLHNYLKAKLHIETSELSKERIRELLEEKSVQNEPIDALLKLLANCEMARYSPYTQADMQNDYQKASEVIAIL